jgi:hypothetical protein
MKASEHGIPFTPQWFWSESDNCETWTNGPYPTKEAAIRDGEPNADGVFYVGEVEEADISAPDAHSAIERAACSLSDQCGEISDDEFDAPAEAIAELDRELEKVFAAWLTKHGLWPTCGAIVNIERVEPQAEGAA